MVIGEQNLLDMSIFPSSSELYVRNTQRERKFKNGKKRKEIQIDDADIQIISVLDRNKLHIGKVNINSL